MRKPRKNKPGHWLAGQFFEARTGGQPAIGRNTNVTFWAQSATHKGRHYGTF